ncbi:hypothetical protein Bbelb_329640 [Branchiostoma belcheri]|nr:hypothetical protein Bbelb_329640 [Branchiostoma belcheri]
MLKQPTENFGKALSRVMLFLRRANESYCGGTKPPAVSPISTNPCEKEPARDLTAARPNCKSRSAPYHTPHGSRRATDRAPDGSLTETGRKIRRTLGVMTPAGVYAEDMPNGRRFKWNSSVVDVTFNTSIRAEIRELNQAATGMASTGLQDCPCETRPYDVIYARFRARRRGGVVRRQAAYISAGSRNNTRDPPVTVRTLKGAGFFPPSEGPANARGS